jgi:hypothetical protein
MVPAVRTYGVPRPVQSMVCVDPARLAGDDLEARLGKTIERVRKLGANAVAIDAFARDAQGDPVAAWFPTTQLPLRADVLSRISWQLQTRAGVRIYVRIPRPFNAAASPDIERLARDLADAVQLDGMLFEAAPAFEGDADASAEPWEIRAKRARIDASVLSPGQASIMSFYRAMERQYPAMRLALVSAAASGPMAIADLTYVDVPVGAPFTPRGGGGRRFGPWITSPDTPPDAGALRAIARAFKAEGSMAAGWCPDDPLLDLPAADIVRAETSTSRTPGKQ